MQDLFGQIDFEPWDDQTLTFSDYAEQAMETAVYPGMLLYPVLGLTGEAGEVAEKVKKYFRDHSRSDDVSIQDPITEMDPEYRDALAHELGDVIWYVTAIASDLGYDLCEIAALNMEKLQSRAERDMLHGDGDHR